MIYIVEDDENIGQMECYALKNSGFGTELFEDSESFFDSVARRYNNALSKDSRCSDRSD